MALITCKNLSVGYDQKPVAAQISFSIQKGDYLCIIGENGSGKSTLMKTLLGLLPPVSGTVVTEEGFSLSNIGYIPQQTPSQKDFPASVQEVVESGLLPRSRGRLFLSKEDKQFAERQMERLDILSLKKRAFKALSGGQQQRVLIARALCAADTMLLMDEPTAGLDVKITEEMYALIDRLNREGMTVVMISHDMDKALKGAGKLLHIGKHAHYFGAAADYPQWKKAQEEDGQ